MTSISLKQTRIAGNRRILFVILLGSYFPSGVRRVLDYLPTLKKEGWETSVVSYSNPLVYKWLRDGSSIKRKIEGDIKIKGFKSLYVFAIPFAPVVLILYFAAKTGLMLLSLIHRCYVYVRLFTGALRHDVLFFQQVTPSPFITRLLKNFCEKIVFDIDDAVFLFRKVQTETILQSASVATPGSHYNLDFCKRHCRNVVFLPTPVPHEKFEEASRRVQRLEGWPMRIGWVGSPMTVHYLEIVKIPLERLGRKYPDWLTFCIVGAANRFDLIPRFENIEIDVIPWVHPERIPDIIAGLDIGVMPLHDTDWEKGKCGLKALEYMAAGIPALCSQVGENNFIINDGVNGMLAETPQEWEEKLELLLLNPGIRRRLGESGQMTVRERYSTEKCSRILLEDVLNPLMSSVG